MALALMRNYDSFKSPTHFKLTDLLKKFDKTFGATKAAEKGKYGKVEGDRTMDDIEKRRADRWNFLFIAGMWFQDLFNYDFRRTEMCIIPYATQQGEISFCAYNTGIGWRNIIEKMHMTATLTKWYEEHGRHEIFAGNKAVPLDVDRALAEAERGSGPRRRADRPRRPRHREERARREARGAQAQDARGAREGSGAQRRDGQALRAARAQGAADAPDPGAGRQEEGRRAGGGAAQADCLEPGSGFGIRRKGRRATAGLFLFLIQTSEFRIEIQILEVSRVLSRLFSYACNDIA